MSETNTVETLLAVFSNPFRFLPGVVEYMFAWLVTRRFIGLLLISPVLIAVLGMVSLTLAGEWWPGDKLAAKYLALADQETTEIVSELESEKANAETVEAFFEKQSVSQDAELYLRRVLDLTSNNQRATFLVGLRLADEKRLGQARALMRKIAPENASGFPPAHAWLAVDGLMRSKGMTQESRSVIMQDMEVACTWPRVGWNLVGEYANWLAQDGKIGEAISVLENAATESPELELQLANLAFRAARPQTLARVSQQATERIEQRVAEGSAGKEEIVKLATICLMNSDTAKARELAGQALRESPEDPSLVRIVSESYRVDFIKSLRTTQDGTELELGLLDAALKSDPTNPAVAQEVARLLAAGKDANEDLQKALQGELSSGRATALTHILLAEKLIVEDKLKEAIVHLEIANRQAPNSPNIMNNLALAIARVRPDELNRALELADKAVKTTGRANPLFLDTQGEIRSRMKDYTGAIESYEAAIGIDEDNADIRRRLAKTYRYVGLNEMADVHEKKLEKMETNKE